MKFNTEFRHLWNMDKNNKIASRVALGALFAYGNATIAPYSEQFYVGGANSIRAFTVRSLVPVAITRKTASILISTRQVRSVSKRT